MLNIYLIILFILLTCSIPDIRMYFQSEWKTLWILIRWLLKKPSDQDLQCFLKINKINRGLVGQGLKQKGPSTKQRYLPRGGNENRVHTGKYE